MESLKRKKKEPGTNFTAKQIKFSIKDFFSKCDQFRRTLWIRSHFPNKSLIENFIFCAVFIFSVEKHDQAIRENLFVQTNQDSAISHNRENSKMFNKTPKF